MTGLWIRMIVIHTRGNLASSSHTNGCKHGRSSTLGGKKTAELVSSRTRQISSQHFHWLAKERLPNAPKTINAWVVDKVGM